MELSLDGSELALEGGMMLTASYKPQDGGCGKLLLRCTNAASFEFSEISMLLDPWNAEGYLVEQWTYGGAVVLCGAARIVIVRIPDLSTQAAIPLEYEECEVDGVPWFTSDANVSLISTEARVFCLDKRLAFRWCWTIRAYSKDWWGVSKAPAIAGSVVRIPISSASSQTTLSLDIESGVPAQGAFRVG